MTAMLTLTAGVASAGITVPAYPTVGVYPTWDTAGTGTAGTQTASNIVRGAGSDTTFFMMQQIGDLYTQAGLYGCTLIGSGAGEDADCDNVSGTAPNYSDVATTDTVDNFDRTEVLQGVNKIGSGNGQKELCGTLPTPDAVDYARSSKPAGSISGCNMVQLGYAKDSVPVTDFQSIDPEAVGTPSYYESQTFNGVAFPTGGIGPVAAGWLPGDPKNCVAAGEGLEGTPCSGTPFNDVDNSGRGEQHRLPPVVRHRLDPHHRLGSADQPVGQRSGQWRDGQDDRQRRRHRRADPHHRHQHRVGDRGDVRFVRQLGSDGLHVRERERR